MFPKWEERRFNNDESEIRQLTQERSHIKYSRDLNGHHLGHGFKVTEVGGGGEGILDWALVAILNSRIGTNDNFNIFTYGSLHRASRFNIGAKALGNLVPRIPYYVCYSSRWASQLVLPKGCIQTLQLAGSVFCVPE